MNTTQNANSIGAKPRKYRTEFIVQGHYGTPYGWEDETSEETHREARQRLREYRDNGPGSYRLIRRRVLNEVA